MLLLIGIGLAAGIVTGISPCILPVLPMLLASGASGGTATGARGGSVAVGGSAPGGGAVAGGASVPGGDSVAGGGSVAGAGAQTGVAVAARPVTGQRLGALRQAVPVVAGIAVSFSIFTLFGTALLNVLHLPQDFLHNAAIVALALVGIGLLIPAVGAWLERPFAPLGRRRQLRSATGFLLGVTLGLLFVPCAGPVLAAITTVAASSRVGFSAIVLTAAYAVGTALPMLAIAVVGQRLGRALRAHAAAVRRVSGAVLLVMALAIWANATAGLQRDTPAFANSLQQHIEGNGSAKRALAGITGNQGPDCLKKVEAASGLAAPGCAAPGFVGITDWLNTPGGHPLTLAGLRGKVVLVDFWTYSCINCQRSLPHVEAWARTYGPDGLVVVGVHTPEFSFEHVVGNVRVEAARLGVRYPIAIDDNYRTWDAYANQYWPAEYLIDRQGQLRHVSFGEGDYAHTESLIRTLLATSGASLPASTSVPNRTPTEATTPESYVGYERLDTYVGAVPIAPSVETRYELPATVPDGGLSLGGLWSVGPQAATANGGSVLELHFDARDVYLVLGGSGHVQVSVNGHHSGSVTVSGPPTLYTLVHGPDQDGVLRLDVSPGVMAYDFTFG